jgi:hypothetical protein
MPNLLPQPAGADLLDRRGLPQHASERLAYCSAPTRRDERRTPGPNGDKARLVETTFDDEAMRIGVGPPPALIALKAGRA